MNVALSIAGSDSSCGAGIQADLRMFSACGVFGTTVITALTAQNPGKINGIMGVSAEFVKEQINAIFSAFSVKALKTGMLWSAATIATIAKRINQQPSLKIVVDPVMISTSGRRLVAEDALINYRQLLLPACTLATPNIDEAELLLGVEKIQREDQVEAAKALQRRFGCAVLLKGGHLQGEPVDVLVEGEKICTWRHSRITGVDAHGTGCMLSAAITAYLAKGNSLVKAVELGIAAVQYVLQHPVALGEGCYLAGIESFRAC